MAAAITVTIINILCMAVGFCAGVVWWDERGNKR